MDRTCELCLENTGDAQMICNKCIQEGLEAELMRRLTPPVTGDVGELLDKLEKEMSLIGWSTHDDDPSDLLELVRQAVADLQADRERLEWLMEHDARCYSRSILYRKVKYFVNYRKEGNVFVNTACFDTPRAAINAAMKGAE